MPGCCCSADRHRTVSEQRRQELIAKVAYRHAEERGFTGGDPAKGWLEAEREVGKIVRQTLVQAWDE